MMVILVITKSTYGMTRNVKLLIEWKVITLYKQIDLFRLEIVSKLEIHPIQISTWEREFIENFSTAFELKSKADDSNKEKSAPLYSKIGELQIENDFLKKVFGQMNTT